MKAMNRNRSQRAVKRMNYLKNDLAQHIARCQRQGRFKEYWDKKFN